jgi:hypothetical protein
MNASSSPHILYAEALALGDNIPHLALHFCLCSLFLHKGRSESTFGLSIPGPLILLFLQSLRPGLDLLIDRVRGTDSGPPTSNTA